MELKYRIRGITITLLNSSNRTFMELKFCKVDDGLCPDKF